MSASAKRRLPNTGQAPFGKGHGPKLPVSMTNTKRRAQAASKVAQHPRWNSLGDCPTHEQHAQCCTELHVQAKLPLHDICTSNMRRETETERDVQAKLPLHDICTSNMRRETETERERERRVYCQAQPKPVHPRRGWRLRARNLFRATLNPKP